MVILAVLLYFIASAFIVLGFMMLFAYHRTRRSELLLFSFLYSGSGLVAGYTLQWWPLIAGLVVAWLFKLAGYDADRPIEPPADDRAQAPGSGRSGDQS